MQCEKCPLNRNTLGKKNASSLRMCVCDKFYYMNLQKTCSLCPSQTSRCDQPGLEVPVVKPGYWRFDPRDQDLATVPFYKCPQEENCLGGNSTRGRCPKEYDDDGPLCATCATGYVFQSGACIPCPGRTSANEFSAQVFLVSVIGIVVFGVVSYWYLTARAMTKKDLEFLKAALKHVDFKKNTVRRQSFVKLVRTNSLSFGITEIEQAFDMVDNDGSGELEQAELDTWMGENRFDELASNLQGLKDVSDIVGNVGTVAAKAMWDTISQKLEALERVVKTAKKELERLRPQFSGSIKWPFTEFEVSLAEIHVVLQKILRGFVRYMEDAAFLRKCLSEWLRALDLLVHGLVPNVSLPRLKFPGWDEFSIKWRSLWMPWDDIKIDFGRLLSCDWPELCNSISFDLPPLNVGGWLMSLKIFVGFSQCFCYFAITFDIPWPRSLLVFMQYLELTSFDFYAVFGNVSCMMQTGYLQKFNFHMMLFPCIVAVAGLAYLFAKVTRCRKHYTPESLKTQFTTLLFLVAFTLYTGVTTRLFRLFKCQKVQDTWYLVADYTVDCNSEEYRSHAVIAYACMLFFVIGLPLSEFVVLWKNRKNLFKEGCADPVLQRKLEKELGSIYAHYHPHAYLFDVLDLLRRLLLTGALILMGEESVAQVFLGILICIAWLCMLMFYRPYRTKWDNIIAIILAAHLSFTLVSGMALKLYEATPGQDEYQTTGFGIVLLGVSLICVGLSILAILFGMPCIQNGIEYCQTKRKRRVLQQLQDRPRRQSGAWLEHHSIELTQQQQHGAAGQEGMSRRSRAYENVTNPAMVSTTLEMVGLGKMTKNPLRDEGRKITPGVGKIRKGKKKSVIHKLPGRRAGNVVGAREFIQYTTPTEGRPHKNSRNSSMPSSATV